MALTPSNMLPLGTRMPEFALPDTDGKLVKSSAADGAPATLVMFICNHCPYVVHVRSELARLTAEYMKKDVRVFAINANDVQKYPDDSPEKMALEKKQHGYAFPYLFDESQSVARAFDAACTPDFYVFDSQQTLVYRGQMDASRPGSQVPVTGRDLRRALDAVLAGTPVDREQLPSMGCNIKWKVT